MAKVSIIDGLKKVITLAAVVHSVMHGDTSSMIGIFMLFSKFMRIDYILHNGSGITSVYKNLHLTTPTKVSKVNMTLTNLVKLAPKFVWLYYSILLVPGPEGCISGHLAAFDGFFPIVNGMKMSAMAFVFLKYFFYLPRIDLLLNHSRIIKAVKARVTSNCNEVFKSIKGLTVSKKVSPAKRR
jgi:hypothetical protein